MARITVFGGTGYTGLAIVREAVARGHEVTSVSRNAASDPIPRVIYVHGSLLSGDPGSLVADAEVVVAAMSPRGDLAGKIADIYTSLAEAAIQTGAQFVVIGGFSSLRRTPGGPRIADSDVLDPRFAAEARELSGFADWLLTTPEDLDWLYISPAAGYGAFAPGEVRGTYRIGGDVVLENSQPELSAPDFAAAVVDVIESGQHHREHLSVTY